MDPCSSLKSGLQGFYINYLFGGSIMAIYTKGKRKIVFNDAIYYWFVRIEKDGSHRIHILTEDKKLLLGFFTSFFSPPIRHYFL